MKNFLNRLTRLMIIMLMLVDRTPFFNVFAANDKSTFTLRIDINGTINQGCGVGQYDLQGDLDDSLWNPALQNDSEYLRSLVLAVIGASHPYANFVYSLADVKFAGDDLTNVCVDGPINIAPVAVNDTYATNEDVDLIVDVANGVLMNDSDANGEPMTAVLVSTTTSGALTLNSDGSFSYDPNLNYFGTDSFTYKVIDLRGFESNIATVTINILSVNDLPIVVSESHSINRGGTVNDAVTGSDVETSTANLTFVIETGPTDYSSFTFNADGTFSYVHDITKSATPVSFTFRAKDADNALSSNLGTVTINISNLAPATDDRSFSTDEDTALNVNAADGLLKNSTDPESDALLVDTTVGTAPTKGSVVLSADGSFVYTPNANLNGSDSFTYRVSDGKTYSSYKTVTITINPVDDAPVAVNDTATTAEDTPVDIDVLLNDTDVDGGTKSVSSFTNGSNGSVSKNLDGTLKYTPNANFNGSDSFTYTLNGGSTATVTVTVTPVDDAPVAVNDTATTPEVYSNRHQCHRE